MRQTVAEQLVDTPGGVDLARLIALAVADLDVLTDTERLELVKATARQDAWTASVRAEAIAAVYDSARAEMAADAAELARAEADAGAPTPPTVPAQRGKRRSGRVGLAGLSHGFDELRLLHRRVGTEVALVLGTSTWVADREVAFALGLQAHPRLARALRDGLLDRTQAGQIVSAASLLTRPGHSGQLVSAFLGPDDSPDGDDFDPDEPATDIDDHGRPVPLIRELGRPGATLWALTAGRLRGIAEREVLRIDPTAAADQAARSRSERRVDFDPQPRFMTELHLRTTTDLASAAYDSLDRAAREARHAGDPRNLDQLRADIAIGHLTEGQYGTRVIRSTETTGTETTGTTENPDTIVLPRPAGALLHLTMAATTALGLDDYPATLHGPTGQIPVPAEIGREIAHRDNTRWRRLLCDPATGIATDLSGSYRPPRRLANFVRARDGQITRFPTSCATHLELDHVEPYNHAHPADGGQTTAANLSSDGQRDHHLVTDRVITVTGNANDTLTITTPSGRSYLSHPHIYLDPEPVPHCHNGDPPY